MIPKILHYCWMSNDPWDKKTQECFNSWKKFLPDYEYYLWNFQTLPDDVLNTPTVRNAIENKKWAFVADYVRVWALLEFGGIYLDLDVEVLKSLTPILSNKIVWGLERQSLGAHMLASTPNSEFYRFVLTRLKDKVNFMPLPLFLTNCFREFYGINPTVSCTDSYVIYPNEYFNPYFWDEIVNEGQLTVTDSTFLIHWYSGGWIPKYKKTYFYKKLIQLMTCIGAIKYLRRIRGY